MKNGELYQCNSQELFEKQWACNVVTKDIPANVVALGNPCRVQKEV